MNRDIEKGWMDRWVDAGSPHGDLLEELLLLEKDAFHVKLSQNFDLLFGRFLGFSNVSGNFQVPADVFFNLVNSHAGMMGIKVHLLCLCIEPEQSHGRNDG